MYGKLKNMRGFTIIELALVMIVMGVLAAALVPMAHVVHEDAMREQDLASLETAKKALMGYIRVHEAVPCLDAAGNQVPGGCDATQTLNLLGVRTTDSRRMNFVFDVNDTLTQSDIAASGNTLCAALADIIDPPFPPAVPFAPSVCDSANANTGDTACVAANPMALVLVGRGSDRCLNLENAHASALNDAVCPDAVAANRTFENPARIHSRTQDDGYYEDLVLTVTPAELAQEMGCSGSGNGNERSICESGETFIQASYGENNNWLGVQINGVCYTVGAGTMAALGCIVDGTPISLRRNANCAGNLLFNGLAEELDTNNDGRADIVCNDAICNYR